MLRVVVVARSEGVETTRKAINWGFESHIIVIGKEDVEATIELRGC
jgi:Ni2+-binding GTPase involved in maturation of urease and hydrogenase